MRFDHNCYIITSFKQVHNTHVRLTGPTLMAFWVGLHLCTCTAIAVLKEAGISPSPDDSLQNLEVVLMGNPQHPQHLNIYFTTGPVEDTGKVGMQWLHTPLGSENGSGPILMPSQLHTKLTCTLVAVLGFATPQKPLGIFSPSRVKWFAQSKLSSP